MLSLTSIVRHRKERTDQSRTLPIIGKIVIGTITFVFTLFLAGAFLLGLMYVNVLEDLPPVGNIELLYGQTTEGFLEPIQVFDRDGEKIFDLIHPLAANRRWMRVSGTGSDVLPREVINAFISSQDESFWSNCGYDLNSLLFTFLRGEWADSGFAFPRTIAQRLVAMTVLPSEDLSGSALNRYFREAILAQRLTDHYNKEQILEWYVNTVGFGPLISGIDAGAIVYFGKGSKELTLAEGAYLVGLSEESDNTDLPVYEFLKQQQEQLLHTMGKGGLISEFERRSAISEEIIDNSQLSFAKLHLQIVVWEKLKDLLGPAFQHRTNLEVFTSIDANLQRRLLCTINATINQANEHGEYSEGSRIDKDECLSISTNQPILLGNYGPSNNELELAGVVLDPESGEILASIGPADLPVPIGSMIYPFIYLTSFSKGTSPGSMVLDIASESESANENDIFGAYQAMGPVRIRTALLGGYPFAAERTILSTGLDDVLQVIEQMGVVDTQFGNPRNSTSGALEMLEISLMNAVYGYGVIANGGKMVGMGFPSLQQNPDNHELEPILIRRVQEYTGKILYEVAAEELSVLSQELAYLVSHILSDDTERWSVQGSTEIPEQNLSLALMRNNNLIDNRTWTVGYTPSRVVGIWLQDKERITTGNVDESINTDPLWAAVIQEVVKDLPREGWDVPAGIVSKEVCDPSGLLPTEHCPRVVEEVYLEGTEPISYDNFYKPIMINKDTGKLATAFTPPDKIEELIFILPPSGARNWARGEGIMQPPNEYDTYQASSFGGNDLGIGNPVEFEYVSGLQWISGWMEVEDFSFYRLLYGKGLNPTHWYQIGDNHDDPVKGGSLGLWDTMGLDGLYALQLVVVDEVGIARIATTYVTVDNIKPKIEVIAPLQEETLPLPHDGYPSFDVSATDNIGISRVEFYLDGKRIGTKLEAPFAIQVPTTRSGEVFLNAKVYDLAGNFSESEVISILVPD